MEAHKSKIGRKVAVQTGPSGPDPTWDITSLSVALNADEV